MKTRLIFLLKYYLFWILFFVLQKPLFMLWQGSMLGDVNWVDWVLVVWHGLPLDMSVAAYITAVTGLLLCFSNWIKWRFMRPIIYVLSGVVLFVGLWVVIADNSCFPSWGYHLNKDVFSYMASPKDMFACAPWWQWVIGVVACVAVFIVLGWLMKRWMREDERRIVTDEMTERTWLGKLASTFGMLLVTALLFLPMRGSVTVSTMNTGRVYFSSNRMLNLAAINPLFNVMESLSEDHFSSDKYQYMTSEDAEKWTEQLFAIKDTILQDESLFTTSRPNIVLVILESFSYNAMQEGAMPRLSQLASEGIHFQQTYAASYRTDRGVVAVLGAFPGCATASLMMVPEKSAQLPQIGQVLKQEGYRLKFYYGGDEDFTNMRSYLIAGGFEDRVADRDFPLSDKLSKWGAPDHIVFSRAAKEIGEHTAADAPYMDIILTLSSHEPFEVPYHHWDNAYLNAVSYTDSCLGAMVDSLRLSPLWDSTIVVMVADHGYPYPAGLQCYEPMHHRVPMVIAGGAVRAPMQVEQCCQQVDWVPTVLHQMDLSAEQFRYAKDVLDRSVTPFAYYNFVDGFALVKDSAVVVFDAESEQVIIGEEHTDQVKQAQAVTQSIMHTIEQL